MIKRTAAIAEQPPDIGSVWVDKDKRSLSGDRRVKVLCVDDFGFVRYKQVSHYGREYDRVYISRWRRFVKAFRKVDQS
jgi:hypothetical protein